MTTVAIISGSPSRASKTNRVAEWVSEQLQRIGHTVYFIRLRDLPAEDLLYAHSSSDSIVKTHDWIRQSRVVVVLSPVYKGSYTGILKAYLDLLPEKAFAGKLVVPIVTGGPLLICWLSNTRSNPFSPFWERGKSCMASLFWIGHWGMMTKAASCFRTTCCRGWKR